MWLWIVNYALAQTVILAVVKVQSSKKFSDKMEFQVDGVVGK